jgi:hypothetical protein
VKIGKYKIPFDKDRMLEYTTADEGEVASPGKSSWHMPTEWRDNVPFKATLKLTGQYRGRSAARVCAVNTKTKETYSFALGAFYEAVVTFGAEPTGILKGTWVFRKQGANYGLYPFSEEAGAK